MSNKARNTSGKFAAKSETPRKIRSVNLTDDAWQWLATVAAQAGVSRNDYLEAMAEGGLPFMETVKPQDVPLIETVASEIQSDDANITELPTDKVLPLIETVHPELESLKQRLDEVEADRAKLLESTITIKSDLERQVQELRSQLATERADREEVETQLSDLKQNSAPASELSEKTLPDEGTILNRARQKDKKTPITLPIIRTILGIIEES